MVTHRSFRVIFLLLFLLLPCMVLATPVNIISSIQAKEDGARIEIIGSKKPDFTTFQLRNPSRLVVDFSPAKFGETFSEQGIETKFINAVQTAVYEMGESAIARIVFTLKQEIGFEVHVEKNKLLVHIHGDEPFVAKMDAMLTNNKTNLLSETREEISEGNTEQEEIEEEEAEGIVLLERKRAEEKRKAEQEEAKKRLAEEKKAKAEEAARLAMLERKRAEEKRKAEQEEAKKRLAEEKKAKAEEAARLAMLERKRAEEKRKAEQQEIKKRQISGRLELVGFRQDGQYSRVLVRTNQPIRYSIGKANSKILILRLENTKIGNRSVLRFLDTQYFDSPVNRVWPRIAGNAIEVEIELKLPATYGIRQQGEVIIVEFLEVES